MDKIHQLCILTFLAWHRFKRALLYIIQNHSQLIQAASSCIQPLIARVLGVTKKKERIRVLERGRDLQKDTRQYFQAMVKDKIKRVNSREEKFEGKTAG